MVSYKEFVAKQFLNKTVRFKCDCIVPLDVTGKVINFYLEKNEIIYIIESNNKIIKIGENTPNLMVSFI
jgi:hypothetical protein